MKLSATFLSVSFDISPTKFSTTALSSTIVFGFSLQPLPLLLPRSKHPVGLDQDSLQAKRNLSGWKLLFLEIHSGGRLGDNRENPSIKKLYSSHNFWHTLIPHFINVTRVSGPHMFGGFSCFIMKLGTIWFLNLFTYPKYLKDWPSY